MSWWNPWSKKEKPGVWLEPLAKPSPVDVPQPEAKPKELLCCNYPQATATCKACGATAAFCEFKGDEFREELPDENGKKAFTIIFSSSHPCQMCGSQDFTHHPKKEGELLPCAEARKLICPKCQEPNTVPCENLCSKLDASLRCSKCMTFLNVYDSITFLTENLLDALKRLETALRRDLAQRGQLDRKGFLAPFGDDEG